MQFEIEVELSEAIGSSRAVETRRFSKSVEMPAPPPIGYDLEVHVGEWSAMMRVNGITRNVEDGTFRVSVTAAGLTFALLRQDKTWHETLL